MVLGIIGALSRHVEFFSEALKRKFPGGDHLITHIWGQDAPQRIDECCRSTDIKVVCDTPEQLINSCDGVIIALRDGARHAALAEACFARGKPAFIDKPFTCSVSDAQCLLACARQHSVAFTGGSTLCFTDLVQTLAANMPKCEHYTLSYQADPHSPFGGWYFYGSHLTDLCTTLFGLDFLWVSAAIDGAKVKVLIEYPSFCVSLNSSPQVQPPVLLADKSYILDDMTCYEAGMAHFVNLINGKASNTEQRLLASVKLLDAVLSSLRTGGPVRL